MGRALLPDLVAADLIDGLDEMAHEVKEEIVLPLVIPLAVEVLGVGPQRRP